MDVAAFTFLVVATFSNAIDLKIVHLNKCKRSKKCNTYIFQNCKTENQIDFKKSSPNPVLFIMRGLVATNTIVNRKEPKLRKATT